MLFSPYFSSAGRLNRRLFFWYSVTLVVVSLCTMILFAVYFQLVDHLMNLNPTGLLVPMIVLLAILVLTLVGIIHLQRQRLHDMDVTGWGVLFNFVDITGLIFTCILLFKHGTVGPNRFGPDPLGSVESQLTPEETQ